MLCIKNIVTFMFICPLTPPHPRPPNQKKKKILDLGGWLGGAMVLGKLPVPGHLTIWMIVGQWPIALAIGAGGVVLTFLFPSIFTLLFLPLSARRLDMD